MPTIIAAGITWLVTALGGTVVAGSITAAVIGYASAAIFYAGAYLYARRQAKKLERSLTGGSPIQMSREPAPAARVVYGRQRVSGPIVFAHTEGSDNVKLHLVLALAGHELSQIESFFLNDEALAAPVQEATGRLAGAFFVNRHLGAAGQTADWDLVAQSGGAWTATHRLRGIAYLYCQLLWDQDKFPTGLPNISAIVQGKPVLDPRAGATAYSANPALILHDYLTDTDFGCAFPAGEIDTASFIAAANICDEAVPLAAGGSQPRYQCHAIFDTDAEPATVIDEILSTMAGQLAYVSGQWILHAGADRPTVLTLGPGHLAGGIVISPREPLADTANLVRGTYSEPGDNWLPRDFPALANSTYLAEDQGVSLPRDMELPWVCDPYQAQRLAKIALESARQDITVRATWQLHAIEAIPGSVVALDFPDRYGWTNKKFMVMSWSFTTGPDGALAIATELREYASAIWAWSEEETQVDLAPNTSLPQPWSVAAPTGLALASGAGHLLVGADGTITSRIHATWTAPADTFVASGGLIELQYKKSADTDWIPAGFLPGATTSAYISPVQDGLAYDVRLRSVSSLGVRSAWLEVADHTVAGDAVAPAPVTGLTATALQRGVLLEFAAPADLDLSHYRVYWGAVDDFGSATNSADAFSTHWPITGLTPGTALYFWIKAIDSSGNLSTAAGSVTATPLADPAAFAGQLQVEFDGSLSALVPLNVLAALRDDNGDQVVTTRQAHIADPTSGDSTSNSTAIIAILEALRAHGLIASGPGTPPGWPAEFDVAGATYYAVAPAGYTYSSEQDTQYSTRKYNTLAAAVAGLATSPGTPQVINILGDWSSAADTTAVTISGVTTTAANYILIRAIGQARHQGVWTSSAYRLLIASAIAIRLIDDHVRLDGLQLGKSSSSSNTQPVVRVENSGLDNAFHISHCIIKQAGNNSFTEAGIHINSADSKLKAWNCIIYGSGTNTNNNNSAIAMGGNQTLEVYSCTLIGGQNGLYRGSGTVTAKNCYARGNAAAYSGTMTLTTCASADTTGSAGLQNIPHSTATFVSVTAGSQDYHLAVGSALLGAGTDTSGEAAPLDFAHDIDGQARSTPWDIGADDA